MLTFFLLISLSNKFIVQPMSIFKDMSKILYKYATSALSNIDVHYRLVQCLHSASNSCGGAKGKLMPKNKLTVFV